jgi:hypothetical protein
MHAHTAAPAGPGRAIGRLGWFPLDAATPWTTLSRKLFTRAIGTDGTLRA